MASEYPSTGNDDYPTWSPSNNEIAYQGASEAACQTSIASPQWRLANNARGREQWKLQPDTPGLVTARGCSGVRRGSASGTASGLLTLDTGHGSTYKCDERLPGVFADGQEVAYVTPVSASVQDIRVIGLGGGVSDTLVRMPSTILQPRWTPDGQWIYFLTSDSLNLYAVSRSGHNVSQRFTCWTRFYWRGRKRSIFARQRSMAVHRSGSISYSRCTGGAGTMGFNQFALRDTMALDRRAQARFYGTGADFSTPRLSPNGIRAAYVRKNADPSPSPASDGNKNVMVGQISYNTLQPLPRRHSRPLQEALHSYLCFRHGSGRGVCYLWLGIRPIWRELL